MQRLALILCALVAVAVLALLVARPGDGRGDVETRRKALAPRSTRPATESAPPLTSAGDPDGTPESTLVAPSGAKSTAPRPAGASAQDAASAPPVAVEADAPRGVRAPRAGSRLTERVLERSRNAPEPRKKRKGGGDRSG